jgi:hypothetical protein
MYSILRTTALLTSSHGLDPRLGSGGDDAGCSRWAGGGEPAADNPAPADCMAAAAACCVTGTGFCFYSVTSGFVGRF